MGRDQLDRLLRRLRARSEPHAVVRVGDSRFDLVPQGSPRLEALLRSPEWAVRVVGVFSPDVALGVLHAAVLA